MNNWVWNYFKQIPVSLKIYAEFECNLRGVSSCQGSYTKKYQDYIPCSFAYNVVCVDDRFTKAIVVSRGENAAYEFIRAILKESKYCKKVIDNDEEKVRDPCHVTGKFRNAAHWDCNINFQLTKKVPVIFHNLRGYDSHSWAW